jgi:hypothetical protein
MVVFRLHGDEFVFGGSVHPVQPTIPQMKMMKVHIPFTFKIQESSKSSYNGESKKLYTAFDFRRSYRCHVPFFNRRISKLFALSRFRPISG